MTLESLYRRQLLLASAMNTMNLTETMAVEVDSLEEDYAVLNDNDDMVTSRKDRGPCIQFSDWAVSRFC